MNSRKVVSVGSGRKIFSAVVQQRGRLTFCASLLGMVVAASVLALAGRIAANDAIRGLGRVVFFRKEVTAKCTGGIQLLRTLAVPGVPRPWVLRPGIVWQGNESLLLIRGDSSVLEYHFRKGHKTRVTAHALPRIAKTIPASILESAAGPVVPVLSLPKKYSSVRQILVYQLAKGTNRLALTISLASHPRRWGRNWPNQGYCVGPPDGDWVASVALPHRHFRALSHILDSTDFGFVGYSIHVWNLRSGRQMGSGYPVIEPWAEAFCSPRGHRLGWVCAGHWLRVVNVQEAPRVVRSFRLIASELRAGAFAPGGNRVVMLSDADRNIGSRLSVKEIDLRSPSVERELELAPRRAIIACAPKFSPGGRRIAVAAAGKFGNRFWILSSKTLRLHAMATCHGDLIQSMAFSPDGHQLAVEFWYRVLIFRLPKFISGQGTHVHEPAWDVRWTRPTRLLLPINHPMAPLVQTNGHMR